MDQGLLHSVAAMRASERRIDSIATNLANLSSPAYKRAATFTTALEVEIDGQRVHQIRTGVRVDHTQGVIVPSEDPWSLAIEGEGFFAVETSIGEVYTRHGAFHVDGNGTLLTIDGFQVAWEGFRARVDPNGKEVVVDRSGLVRQGDTQIGRLKVVEFADKNRLFLDDSGYFLAQPGAQPRTASGFVHQRSSERSNVQSVDELVGLIQAQRSFESALATLRSIDQSYRRLNQAR